MKRYYVGAFDYTSHIMKTLPKGILLTTKAGDKVNSMVIGWGAIGVNWGKPSFVAYIRESRFTKTLLDKNPEFTVNVPVEELDPAILKVCARTSGRDTDKVKEAGLTLFEGEKVSVPAVREAPITLECKVLYSEKQVVADMPEEVVSKYYPDELEGEDGLRPNAHTTYFAEIVNAYVLLE